MKYHHHDLTGVFHYPDAATTGIIGVCRKGFSGSETPAITSLEIIIIVIVAVAVVVIVILAAAVVIMNIQVGTSVSALFLSSFCKDAPLQDFFTLNSFRLLSTNIIHPLTSLKFKWNHVFLKLSIYLFEYCILPFNFKIKTGWLFHPSFKNLAYILFNNVLVSLVTTG